MGWTQITLPISRLTQIREIRVIRGRSLFFCGEFDKLQKEEPDHR